MAKTKKIITWTITSVLAFILVFLGIIYILPGYDLYMVRSESMVPNIRMGDVIVTGPVGGFINGTLKPGMVVTYQHGQDLITHRVVSITGNAVVMKGDALQHPDPWPVNLRDIKRVFLFDIPFIGFILNFMRTKTGWFLAIIVPSAILIGLLIWEIMKEALKDEKKVSTAEVKLDSRKAQATISKSKSKVKTRHEEVPFIPEPAISKAQVESNARLRRTLT